MCLYSIIRTTQYTFIAIPSNNTFTPQWILRCEPIFCIVCLFIFLFKGTLRYSIPVHIYHYTAVLIVISPGYSADTGKRLRCRCDWFNAFAVLTIPLSSPASKACQARPSRVLAIQRNVVARILLPPVVSPNQQGLAHRYWAHTPPQTVTIVARNKNA